MNKLTIHPNAICGKMKNRRIAIINADNVEEKAITIEIHSIKKFAFTNYYNRKTMNSVCLNRETAEMLHLLLSEYLKMN